MFLVFVCIYHLIYTWESLLEKSVRHSRVFKKRLCWLSSHKIRKIRNLCANYRRCSTRYSILQPLVFSPEKRGKTYSVLTKMMLLSVRVIMCQFKLNFCAHSDIFQTMLLSAFISSSRAKCYVSPNTVNQEIITFSVTCFSCPYDFYTSFYLNRFLNKSLKIQKYAAQSLKMDNLQSFKSAQILLDASIMLWLWGWNSCFGHPFG